MPFFICAGINTSVTPVDLREKNHPQRHERGMVQVRFIQTSAQDATVVTCTSGGLPNKGNKDIPPSLGFKAALAMTIAAVGF